MAATYDQYMLTKIGRKSLQIGKEEAGEDLGKSSYYGVLEKVEMESNLPVDYEDMETIGWMQGRGLIERKSLSFERGII